MGYSTYFVLSVDKNEDAIDSHIANDDGSDPHYYLVYYDGYWEGEGKWYHHQDDMKVLSALFPDVLFTLKGEGEEGGDLWIEYYKAGKMQRVDAQIVYEEFDEQKLR